MVVFLGGKKILLAVPDLEGAHAPLYARYLRTNVSKIQDLRLKMAENLCYFRDVPPFLERAPLFRNFLIRQCFVSWVFFCIPKQIFIHAELIRSKIEMLS
jgi:hypothetical protein